MKLIFNNNDYRTESITLGGETLIYRAYRDIVYVTNPKSIPHQSMNIYVSEKYFEGEKPYGWTLDEAPIFMPITVGGYMPGLPDEPGIDRRNEKNATFVAISKGYVVAAPGARGRINQDEKGVYVGKAPACIVDLKAAVAYLRANKGRIPGDPEKIISNGTSAGGALSSLLGASGNQGAYEPYLREIGAAQASDKVYGASCYCPITNLEHADMAYEWQYHHCHDFHRFKRVVEDGKVRFEPVHGTMSTQQITMAEDIRHLFPDYVNALNLKDGQGKELTLNRDGEGNFKEYVMSYILESAQNAIDAGEDLSSIDWITIKDHKAIAMDNEAYIRYATRMKATLAFDALEGNTPENQLFGTKSIDCLHFTDYSYDHRTDEMGMADRDIVALLNPMNYIEPQAEGMTTRWRIRHGAVDRDTSLAIPVLLKLKLEEAGAMVDFAFPWGEAHGGDYDLEDLFAWMDEQINV